MGITMVESQSQSNAGKVVGGANANQLARGLLGVFSHIILDAVMHADAIPGAPFSEANPYVGLLSIGQLNFSCLILLLLGTIIGLTCWFARRRSRGDALHSEVRNPT